VYEYGTTIKSRIEADHLYQSELDAYYDGCKLKHFDTKEERIKYETENNLKPEFMKITEETQIKDLVPEGYKLDTNDISGLSFVQGREYFTVPIKKKEVKDFKWYAKEYLSIKTKEGFVEGPYHINISDYSVGIYDRVPFEFKIGLLKFICDDLGFNMLDYVHGLYVSRLENIAVTNAIKSICPPEFLNSIFK